MVDSRKRRSLKALGASIAAPVIPGTMLWGTSTAKSIDGIPNDQELTISVIAPSSAADPVMMKVTNNSDSVTILRRLSPGIVNLNGKTYSLNASLVNSAYAVGGHKTRMIPIQPVYGTESAMGIPTYRHQREIKAAALVTREASGAMIESLPVAFT